FLRACSLRYSRSSGRRDSTRRCASPTTSLTTRSSSLSAGRLGGCGTSFITITQEKSGFPAYSSGKRGGPRTKIRSDELTMMFQVSDECKALGLRAGAVAFRGIHVADRSAELQETILAAAREIQAKFPDSRAVSALPQAMEFQELLRKVNVNPRKLQPSLE